MRKDDPSSEGQKVQGSRVGTKGTIEIALEFCIFTVCIEILVLPRARGSRRGRSRLK